MEFGDAWVSASRSPDGDHLVTTLEPNPSRALELAGRKVDRTITASAHRAWPAPQATWSPSPPSPPTPEPSRSGTPATAGSSPRCPGRPVRSRTSPSAPTGRASSPPAPTARSASGTLTGTQQLSCVRRAPAAISFSPDGAQLASSEAKGSSGCGPSTSDSSPHSPRPVGHDLTDDECQQYLHTEHCAVRRIDHRQLTVGPQVASACALVDRDSRSSWRTASSTRRLSCLPRVERRHSGSSGWTQEQVLGSASSISPLETMTYAAACTERLRLGCAGVRHAAAPAGPSRQEPRVVGPVEPRASGGRRRHRRPCPAVLGVRGRAGRRLGGPVQRGPGADEGVVDRADRHVRWTVLAARWGDHGAQAVPEAASAGVVRWQPPSAVRARSARRWLLRRRVEHDGGLRRAGVERAARAGAAERDPGDFRIAKRVYIVVDDDAEQARQRMAAGLVRIYGEFGRRLEPVAVTGPPDACAAGLREVALMPAPR